MHDHVLFLRSEFDSSIAGLCRTANDILGCLCIAVLQPSWGVHGEQCSTVQATAPVWSLIAYSLTKFRKDLICRFEIMVTLRFCGFGLKIPICSFFSQNLWHLTRQTGTIWRTTHWRIYGLQRFQWCIIINYTACVDSSSWETSAWKKQGIRRGRTWILWPFWNRSKSK